MAVNQEGGGQTDSPRRTLTDDEIAALMAEIEKGQQLGGHAPSAEALDRARRILTGETTPEAALAEIDDKYAGPAS